MSVNIYLLWHTRPRSMGHMKNDVQISHAVGMLIIVRRKVWPAYAIGSSILRFFSFFRFALFGFSSRRFRFMNSFMKPRKALTPIVTGKSSRVCSWLHTVSITCRKQCDPTTVNFLKKLYLKQQTLNISLECIIQNCMPCMDYWSSSTKHQNFLSN